MEPFLLQEWLLLSGGALGPYPAATRWDALAFAFLHTCLEHKMSSWTDFYLPLTLSASFQACEMKEILGG